MDRKVRNYCRELLVESFVAKADPHDFISGIAESFGLPFRLDEDAAASCSHAVIFCQGACELEATLRSKKVPTKIVQFKLTSVANKDKGEVFDVYIGRGTVWGNPYVIGPAGDREEVLRKYKYDFDRRLLRFFENHDENVNKIKGKILGCHCKPAACHGDILAAYINSLDDGE
ncbi:DUF4326 domain-containing protein [Xanthomonas sp. WHRI 7064]